MDNKETTEEFENYLIKHRRINDVVVEFDVFEIVGRGPDNSPVFEYSKNDDEPDRYLHGSIRWDACSNWHFDEQDDCMLHFCGMEGINELQRLFGRMYEITKSHIPSFIG